jgi:hypothetical protein
MPPEFTPFLKSWANLAEARLVLELTYLPLEGRTFLFAIAVE